jgi:hypothetical protein
LLTSFAESVGLSKLDGEIEDLLLSDLESKMLEIIQEAKKFMRHSKRDILKTDDIKHAMDKLSIPVSALAGESVECLWLPLIDPLLIREGPIAAEPMVRQDPCKHHKAENSEELEH